MSARAEAIVVLPTPPTPHSTANRSSGRFSILRSAASSSVRPRTGPAPWGADRDSIPPARTRSSGTSRTGPAPPPPSTRRPSTASAAATITDTMKTGHTTHGSSAHPGSTSVT